MRALLQRFGPDRSICADIHKRAVNLVKQIREDSDPSMMELFLSEYGLSSDEGVALMCLAEALLRVPDGDTIDALIDDKITPSEWGAHLGKSHSSLINASTWALFVTGRVLDEQRNSGISAVLMGAVRRLGEPIIRQAVKRVMKELGDQFVLGEIIEEALDRAEDLEQQGFTHSYDMLGEAACCKSDAQRYHIDYADAITAIAAHSKSADIRDNPGISIKLSALHPRYEWSQKKRVLNELMPRARSLAVLAKSANIGLNIDAEEADRLDLSLDIIEAIVSDPVLAGWDGFGIVVQAYSKRASYVIDYLYDLAVRLDRKFMVRLVKGAYWDSEIKHAQTEGLESYPVFTRKPSTDVSYICCARQLLKMTDRIYPQFATHSAHSAAAIIELADDKSAFEFQRLHGMGEALHGTLHRRHDTRCRIYAPVGKHEDLLAYLVRRLLENGANSSFVSQLVDESVPPEIVAADPFVAVRSYLGNAANLKIPSPPDLYQPQRLNSRGWDLADEQVTAQLMEEINDLGTNFGTATNDSQSDAFHGELVTVNNPATLQALGNIRFASSEDVQNAIDAARPWLDSDAEKRARVLEAAANLYEENSSALLYLLINEAGKTLSDAVAELREAVDFLRYYAADARRLSEGGNFEPLGIIGCISPWNFPLAIFTGQLAAALAASNAVLAKPAESTPLVARLAVSMLHEAGVPKDCLQLLPGIGSEVGAAITSSVKISGICFTGSTATAQHIHRNMAAVMPATAPLIAETGGLNAMLVDSTALPQQAVRDILSSAFQSAGQRCSALRMLYVQDDVADTLLDLLMQAMDELVLCAPMDLRCDIGPLINNAAQQKITDIINVAEQDGRLLKRMHAPAGGTFLGPTVIKVKGIADLGEEVFGPVLHVATFAAQEFEQVLHDINATRYGLTFGLHSRIDDRVQLAVETIQVGNIYINRNQIGAVVGSQPFGGNGLSGTGPKAGGPNYLPRFIRQAKTDLPASGESTKQGEEISVAELEAAFLQQRESRSNGSMPAAEAIDLPGPTGESNRLALFPRGRVLCLGPGAQAAAEQQRTANELGCNAIAVASGSGAGKGAEILLPGQLGPNCLQGLPDLDAVVYWSNSGASELRQQLALRDGAIVPLVMDKHLSPWLLREQHVCIDTTAAGGNAALLADCEAS